MDHAIIIILSTLNKVEFLLNVKFRHFVYR